MQGKAALCSLCWEKELSESSVVQKLLGGLFFLSRGASCVCYNCKQSDWCLRMAPHLGRALMACCVDLLGDDCVDNFRHVLMAASLPRSLCLGTNVGKQSSLWLAYDIPEVMGLAAVAASLSSPNPEQ